MTRKSNKENSLEFDIDKFRKIELDDKVNIVMNSIKNYYTDLNNIRKRFTTKNKLEHYLKEECNFETIDTAKKYIDLLLKIGFLTQIGNANNTEIKKILKKQKERKQEIENLKEILQNADLHPNIRLNIIHKIAFLEQNFPFANIQGYGNYIATIETIEGTISKYIDEKTTAKYILYLTERKYKIFQFINSFAYMHKKDITSEEINKIINKIINKNLIKIEHHFLLNCYDGISNYKEHIKNIPSDYYNTKNFLDLFVKEYSEIYKLEDVQEIINQIIKLEEKTKY
ncbi:MAG: hypothetical protein ACOCP8_10220 [archaeon]